MESKINTWLKYLWKIQGENWKYDKDVSIDGEILEEIRYFLFQIRKETKRNYDLIKEEK
tara:strand:- start:2971 stop:3147 length:177 start_codon:yes stop_codon:yes gene_type:complete